MRTAIVSDQIMQDQQDRQDAPATKRVPKGQRLPQVTPADVLAMVKALADFNGPVSKKRVAGTMGMTVGGGAFEGKWASMGYYGFRDETPDGRYEVSERGRALISDDGAVVLEAKQHALVSTGFSVILNRFSTNPVNLPAIEGVLEEDLGVPESQVKKLAQVLVKSAADAEMVIDDRFQIEAIEPAIEAVGEITVTAAHKPASNRTGKANGAAAKAPPAAPLRKTTPKPKPAAPTAQKVEAEGRSGPFGVSVEIKIDAKEHTPLEIGEIVRQVREPLTSGA
jgi:hypothetical protein